MLGMVALILAPGQGSAYPGRADTRAFPWQSEPAGSSPATPPNSSSLARRSIVGNPSRARASHGASSIGNSVTSGDGTTYHPHRRSRQGMQRAEGAVRAGERASGRK